MNRIIPLLLFCTPLFIITCGKNGNPTNPPDSLPPMTFAYSISSDTLSIDCHQRIDTNYYCNSGDSLFIQIDTETFYPETLMIGDDSVLLWHNDTLTRVDPGSGIQGKWIWATDTLLYGYPYYGVIFQIGPSTVTISISESDKFLMFPWLLRNPQPDISITKTSFYTVFLTGNITGEVVTITWNAAGDETYASNNKQHTQTVYYKKPNTCPNNRPDWYYQFLTANTP
jgi:hypothetical protein